MGIAIKPVVSAKDRAEFIRMPWPIYQQDGHWVPPLIADQKKFLNPKKGLFFRYGEAQLIIAYRDGRPVGRISAQVSRRHDDQYHDDKGFFGFFECEDDQEVANGLFFAAAAWLRERGLEIMRGPASFSVNGDPVALLIDGFDSPPVIGMSYNPP